MPQDTLADVWAARYGETMNKTDAARAFGISRAMVYKHIALGHFRATADGRVFTRSAAAWYETGEPQGTQAPAQAPERKRIVAKPAFRIVP